MGGRNGGVPLMPEETHSYGAVHCDVFIQVQLSGEFKKPAPEHVPSICIVCGHKLTLDPFEPVDVRLEIENVYSDETIKTHVETTIPAPPLPPLAYAYEADDWEQDHIFAHTGTGRDGDAAYFVTVAESSRPDLLPVGTTYEFGL